MKNTALAKEEFPFWPLPISQPYAGPMLGNTTVGLMLWGGADHTLTLTLSRADFWSRQGGAEWVEGQSYQAIRSVLEAQDAEGLRKIFPQNELRPTLLPVGHLTIRFPESTAFESAHLDLHKALLSVHLRTEAGKALTLSIFLDWPTGTVVLSAPKALAYEVAVTAAWHAGKNADEFRTYGAEAPFEAPNGFVQTLPHDPSLALAIARKKNSVFVASQLVEAATPAPEAFARAEASAQKAATLGVRALQKHTLERWASFWADTPTLSLPNPVLQRLYEYGMYKFGSACSSEPDSTPCTLQGPWYDDRLFPPWSGDYHFNINVQECYWPALRGNHVNALRPLFDMVDRWTDRLHENARVFVGIDDGLMLSHAVDDTGKAISAGFWTGMMDHGSTLWVGDMLWQSYRFGCDTEWLRSRVMPFMKGAFNVLYKMLDHEPDGSLSLPVGPSPEYRGADLNAWGRNASFQLAAAHRLVENLLDGAAILGETPDARWSEVAEHLPKAALATFRDKQAIGLWEGLTLEESHRHHSHMAAIFPFDTIDCEDPQWRDIVDGTYRNWIEAGFSWWSGWCVPWASILHTRVGNAEMAELLLEMWERFYTNQGHGTLHDADFTGLSLLGIPPIDYPDRAPNRIMQLDAGGSCTQAIFEMLLHDRRGICYLFRGAPKRWKSVGFEKVLAPGGVLVSAQRMHGSVQSVRLEAPSFDAIFRLANPWPEKSVLLQRGTSQELLSGAVLEIPLRKGDSVQLSLKA